MIKNFNYILCFCFFIIPNKGICQNWQMLGTGINNIVHSLYADTVSQRLYAGGWFTQAGGLNANGVASWDGTAWDTLGSGVSPVVEAILTFMRYNNKLYAGGAFRNIAGMPANGLATWDGVQWDTVPGIPQWPNPVVSIYSFLEINNELYVGGIFDTIGGMYSRGIVKWNGTNWSPININLDPNFNRVYSLEYYNGKFFIGGNILSGSIQDLLMWDGTTVSQVGVGLFGGLTEVETMAVYNGELYIGGIIRAVDGNVGNYIVKWDGTTLSPVGGGVNDIVRQLKVINNELYAVGNFTMAGGVPANYIAKWNGQQWCALGGNFLTTISRIETFGNEIYVGGSFWIADTDTVKYIAKWIGGNYTDTCSVVGVNEITGAENGISIYPNPVSESVTIYLNEKQSHPAEIIFYNVLGEKCLAKEMKAERETVDVSKLPAGIYWCRVISEDKKILGTRKLVVMR
ncbi:MAG TPA: T9SS type A sorting domain-containing protein [Bacteroidia bacterium]|nr:T9SS type A sorting domain-containing protein [Bacteroidia bacterium]